MNRFHDNGSIKKLLQQFSPAVFDLKKRLTFGEKYDIINLYGYNIA